VRPYYEADGIAIYHGDCREILPHLAPASVDLLLTDPPYGVRYVTARRSRSDVLVAPIANDDTLDWMPCVLAECDRILRADRHAYLFADADRAHEVSAMLPATWTRKNRLVWDKGDAGTVGDLEGDYGMNYEAIVYAMKGRRILNPPRPRTILRFPWSGTRDPVHPTVKSVDLLQFLVARSSQPDELVLDPFMGSGTTLRAAANLGRRAIGIEVEERYCEIAAQRMGQTALDLGGVA
jgi:DNA modification methylase